MKIGLDLHGVISDLPDVFKFLNEAVIAKGGEVHILTGSTLEKAQRELDDLGFEKGIHYTILFSIVNHHIENGTEITGYHAVNKNPEFPNEDWDKTKAEYCAKNNINLHIDDSMIYNDYFTTPFARLFTHTNTPKINKPKRLMS